MSNAYPSIRQFLLFMQHKPDDCPAGDGLATTQHGELNNGVLSSRNCIGGFGGCCAKSIDLEALAEELRQLTDFPMDDHTHRFGGLRGGGYRLCEVEGCPAYLGVDGEVAEAR